MLTAARRLSAPTRARIVIVLLAIAIVIGSAAPRRIGDRLQVVLPVLGLSCEVVTGRAPEYLLRYAVLWAGIHGSKTVLGHSAINMRPNGSDAGFPSGHTATAVFGASTLVQDCLREAPLARATVILAAGFTGASRIESGNHTIWQVLAGAVWGLLCDRLLRWPSPMRRGAAVRSDAFRRRAAAFSGRARSILSALWPARRPRG